MNQPYALVMGLLLAAATGALAADAPRVGVADTMVKIPRPGAGHADVRWGQAVRVELARGEFESAQIVIAAPESKALHGVKVTVGALKHGDAQWPASGLSVWRAGYVEMFNLWAPHNDLGWQPDPLLPNRGPFDIEAGMVQPLWLRLRGGEGMPAGVCRGEVVVTAAGVAPMRVPIEVTLWDFTLPAEQHFTYSVPTWGGQWEAMYPKSVTPERWRAYLDLLLDYRVSSFPMTDDEMTHAYGRGQREFCLMCFPVDYVPADTKTKVADLGAKWKALPWSSKATPYVLLGDEAPPQYYHVNQEEGRLVHEVTPVIQRRFTLSPENTTEGIEAYLGAMKGCGDTLILGAATCYATHEMSAKVRAAGFGLWWYYVASHYYIPGTGVDARSTFWRHWKYQVPGQLHWGASYWGDANIAGKDGKHWPEVPWDTKSSRGGDGYLVYPAPGGTGVWPSIRLENIRDGIEDYEYFVLLDTLTKKLGAGERLAANRRLLAMDDGIVKAYKVYDTRPAAYRDYRRRLAEAIVATQRMTGGR